MFWRDWLNGRGKWRIAGLHAPPQQSCAAGAKDVGNEATIATKTLPSGVSRGKYQHFGNPDSQWHLRCGTTVPRVALARESDTVPAA
eukprot:gene854-biopygen6185